MERYFILLCSLHFLATTQQWSHWLYSNLCPAWMFFFFLWLVGIRVSDLVKKTLAFTLLFFWMMHTAFVGVTLYAPIDGILQFILFFQWTGAFCYFALQMHRFTPCLTFTSPLQTKRQKHLALMGIRYHAIPSICQLAVGHPVPSHEGETKTLYNCNL